MRIRHRLQSQRRQAGFTLLELLIAGALLVFGIMTMAGLVGLAVKNNGHSRLDSTATMLNQAVVEQLINGINNRDLINSLDVSNPASATITDCNGAGTAWTINSTGPGAPLCTNTANGCQLGNIDFSDTSFTANDGYHMNYAVCSGNKKVIYDVRWNITAPDGLTHTSILTVGSRLYQAPGPTDTGIINFPINMRVMVGPDPTSETP
jgi:Tfp pilus assembly protein PilV